MKAYWSDDRGRYGTGESYDYFYKFDEDDAPEIFTSKDGLWTYWKMEEGIELLRYNGSEIHLCIPNIIDGMKVISLDSTFDGFYELKSVEIPERVKSLCGVFYGCESLKLVKLPKGVERLEYAFHSCFSLRKIEVPDGVMEFESAFSETAIESFVFPEGTMCITQAFSNCQQLKQVSIPGTVELSSEAFCDCEALEHVELKDGIEKLEDYVLFHCTSLKELRIPESVKEFGEKAVGIMEVREYEGDENAPIRGFRIKGYQVVPGFRIIGVAGSEAERYAKKQGIPFVKETPCKV